MPKHRSWLTRALTIAAQPQGECPPRRHASFHVPLPVVGDKLAFETRLTEQRACTEASVREGLKQSTRRLPAVVVGDGARVRSLSGSQGVQGAGECGWGARFQPP